MKISTEIATCARLVGEERAIELYAKAGFDAWDFSMFMMAKFDWKTRSIIDNGHPLAGPDYLKFARRLKRAADDNGIVCNQGHAPFPVVNATVRSRLKRAIECAAEVECDILIVHPDNYKSAEENAEFYNELLPFAKECGVRLAAENMWGWDKEQDQACFAACSTPEDFCKHIDIVGSESLVACLDIGHAEMRGLGTSAVEMIRALGDRLQALHIHDNDKWHDSHQIPFTMDIDFVPVVRALKEIGYKGYFTLEADQYLSAYTEDNVADGVRKLAESAKRLAQMFEECKI